MVSVDTTFVKKLCGLWSQTAQLFNKQLYKQEKIAKERAMLLSRV